MIRIAIQEKEFGTLLNLLYRVFNIRMTFFDVEGQELDIFDIKGMSNYCATRRGSATFTKKCRSCDMLHFAKAKSSGFIQIYTCHSGLIEGVIPLRDDHQRFLGAIIFGQLREWDQEPPDDLSPKEKRYYMELKESSLEEARATAQLLQFTCESVIQQGLLRYRSPNWAEAIEEYIDAHLSSKITVPELAALVDKSPSYISHHFKEQFGMTPLAYIRSKRLERAREMLRGPALLAEIAHACGFYDEFHLSKAFKREFGLSPKLARQSTRKL